MDVARGSLRVAGDSSCKVYCLVNTHHDHRYTAVWGAGAGGSGD